MVAIMKHDKLSQMFKNTAFLAQADLLTTRKRSKIVATRHVFWAQNYKSCFCGKGYAPVPSESLQRSTDSDLDFRWKERKGKETREGTGRRKRGNDFWERKTKGKKEAEGGGFLPQTSALNPSVSAFCNSAFYQSPIMHA